MLKSMSVRATLVALAWALSFSAYALADSTRQVAIPAGDLRQGLLQLSKEYGVELVYEPELVKEYRTGGVRGNYTAPDAVRLLLKGTPLELRTDPSGAMLIAPPRVNASSAAEDTPPADAAKEGKSNSSRDFRVAQVDQASAGPSAIDRKQEEKEVLDEVVVTGSHIRGIANPAIPVIVINQADIANSGYATVGDVIRNLPQSFGGDQNPGNALAQGNNGGNVSGASSPNLRGLGSSSTLTLIDGRRLAYDGFKNGVDVSSIPLSAIDRIEVLTDGASAIYGSDAIAGVVNIVLRNNYDGAQTSVRFGESTQGGAPERQFNQLLGTSWGTGGVIASYEYYGQDELFARQRTFTDSAPDPTTLLPNQRKNSFFAKVNQSAGDRVQLFVEGLHTDRDEREVYTFSPFASEVKTAVSQLGVSAGANIVLPAQWTASLTGTFAQDRDSEVNAVVDLANNTNLGNTPFHYANSIAIGEGVAQGPLFSTPAGSVKLALGGGYRREGYKDDNPTNASRGISYVFGEALVPFVSDRNSIPGIESLELSLAERYERYSDFGSTDNPKVGLSYRPLKNVTLRGSWGTSFRAPNVAYVFGPRQLYVQPAGPFDASAPADAQLLFQNGPNPSLRPETATTTTAGLDFTPLWISGLKLSATYFHIGYRNRIQQPLPFVFPLSDPTYASFVTLNPSAALQQQLVSESPVFVNLGSAPYDPALVEAILNNQYQNVTRQTVSGVDLTASYRTPLRIGSLEITSAASWLTIKQRLLPTLGFQDLTGTVFNPPNMRGRLGATWSTNSWDISAFGNYIGPSSNIYASPVNSVASWTTLDLSISYKVAGSSWMTRGLILRASATNVTDRWPPEVGSGAITVPGLNYDPTNASPLGRFLSVTLQKDW